jgi:hypothetical protein
MKNQVKKVVAFLISELQSYFDSHGVMEALGVDFYSILTNDRLGGILQEAP